MRALPKNNQNIFKNIEPFGKNKNKDDVDGKNFVECACMI